MGATAVTRDNTRAFADARAPTLGRGAIVDDADDGGGDDGEADGCGTAERFAVVMLDAMHRRCHGSSTLYLAARTQAERASGRSRAREVARSLTHAQ
jgi:hypothetical protein